MLFSACVNMSSISGFVAGDRLNHPDVRPRIRQIANAHVGDIAHENHGVRQHFRNCPDRRSRAVDEKTEVFKLS